MLPDALRDELEGDFGLCVRQGYASADVGVLSYECGERHGMHLHPELIVELLDLVGLHDAADRPIRTFSGGMKKKLDLACGGPLGLEGQIMSWFLREVD